MKYAVMVTEVKTVIYEVWANNGVTAAELADVPSRRTKTHESVESCTVRGVSRVVEPEDG